MRKYKRKEGRVIRFDLAMMLHELFEEPLDRIQEYPKWGMKMVDIILTVIEDGLKRDGVVKVNGFGTFHVKQPRQGKMPHIALHSEGGKFIKDSDYSTIMVEVRHRKKVYFRPSPQLKAMLDGPINKITRQAMENW